MSLSGRLGADHRPSPHVGLNEFWRVVVRMRLKWPADAPCIPGYNDAGLPVSPNVGILTRQEITVSAYAVRLLGQEYADGPHGWEDPFVIHVLASDLVAVRNLVYLMLVASAGLPEVHGEQFALWVHHRYSALNGGIYANHVHNVLHKVIPQKIKGHPV